MDTGIHGTTEVFNSFESWALIFLSPSLRDSEEDLGCLDSHQHVERREQVVHREVRKAKVG